MIGLHAKFEEGHATKGPDIILRGALRAIHHIYCEGPVTFGARMASGGTHKTPIALQALSKSQRSPMRLWVLSLLFERAHTTGSSKAQGTTLACVGQSVI